MLSCKDGVENKLTLFVTCDESMTPFVLLHRDDSFSNFLQIWSFLLSLSNYHLSPSTPKLLFLMPFTSIYIRIVVRLMGHSSILRGLKWGQLMEWMNLKLWLFTIPFVYCGETQQIHKWCEWWLFGSDYME